MSPRTLRQTQVWMVGAITGQDADAPAEDVEKYVTAGPRMSASERFDVYRLGYHARLVECLLDDYPVLAAMLGEDDFESLCRAYVDRHPSTSPNLNAFGRHMAAFCREAKLPTDMAERFDPLRVFASDLAALEWALVEVLHAECPPPLEIAALQALPPEAWGRARFIPSDALHVLHFDYPVNQVFIANRMRDEVPDVPAPAKNAVAVYRKEHSLWRMDLTPAMLGVLEPLLRGENLGTRAGRARGRRGRPRDPRPDRRQPDGVVSRVGERGVLHAHRARPRVRRRRRFGRVSVSPADARWRRGTPP